LNFIGIKKVCFRTHKYIIGILSSIKINTALYLWETMFMHKQQIPEYQEKIIENIRLVIKNYRMNEGLTQSKFSKLAGKHVNSLQRFERGSLKNIKLLTLLNFVDATSMTLSEFFQSIE
jgi:DNA-binding transcriptional regulator YiaG